MADAAPLAVVAEGFPAAAPAAAAEAPYGVLDVGSNSIRLVVVRGAHAGAGAGLQRARAVRPRRHARRNRRARARWGGARARCAPSLLRGRSRARGWPARRGDHGGGPRRERRCPILRCRGPRNRFLAPGPHRRGGSSLCRSRRGLGLPRSERADGGLGRRQSGIGTPGARAARRARDAAVGRAPPRQPRAEPSHRTRGRAAQGAALARSGAWRTGLSRGRGVAGARPAPHGYRAASDPGRPSLLHDAGASARECQGIRRCRSRDAAPGGRRECGPGGSRLCRAAHPCSRHC